MLDRSFVLEWDQRFLGGTDLKPPHDRSRVVDLAVHSPRKYSDAVETFSVYEKYLS